MPFAIRGAPRLTLDQVLGAAESLRIRGRAHARFGDDMVEPLWDMAIKYQLEPVGVIAQSGHETAWGSFTRAVRPEMHNTCGLKWHDSWRRQLVQLPEQGEHTLSHAAFPNWRCGADAQCQHILAYMNQPLPRWQVITDPRYDLALAKAQQVGGAVYWSDMINGIWSISSNYGARIESVMRETFGIEA